MNNTKKIPQITNAKSAKKFFSSSLNGIFSSGISVQSMYSADDIVRVLRNAITQNEYIETYVRNNPSMRTPSADTVFRRIHGKGSEDRVRNTYFPNLNLLMITIPSEAMGIGIFIVVSAMFQPVVV